MGPLDLTVGQSKKDTPVQTLSRIFDKAVGGCTLFVNVIADIYTCDELNRMLSSEIAKEVTNSGCDTLGNLALATGRNKRVDYK